MPGSELRDFVKIFSVGDSLLKTALIGFQIGVVLMVLLLNYCAGEIFKK